MKTEIEINGTNRTFLQPEKHWETQTRGNKINTDAKLNKELRNALNGNKLISTQTQEGRNNLFHSASLL